MNEYLKNIIKIARKYFGRSSYDEITRITYMKGVQATHDILMPIIQIQRELLALMVKSECRDYEVYRLVARSCLKQIEKILSGGSTEPKLSPEIEKILSGGSTEPKLSPEIEKIRDEVSEERALRRCSTCQQDLDKAVSWYLKIGFEDGFNAAAEIFMRREERSHMYATHNHLMKIIQMQRDALSNMRISSICSPCELNNIDIGYAIEQTDKMLRGEK